MGGISIYLTSYTLADMHSIFTKWIVSVPGIGGSLAVVAAMHSRIHRFEVKLMDLEPHDPYAKTAKRVAVLADEQRKRRRRRSLITRGSRYRKSTTQQMKGARSAYQKEAAKKLRNSEGPHMPTPPPVAAAATHHVTYNIFDDNCRNGKRTKPRLNHHPQEFKGWECVFLISHYYHCKARDGS
nr:hypothetical protein [Tanacetum cinerariifolium]